MAHTHDFCSRSFALARRVFEIYPKLAATSVAHAHLASQLFDSGSAIGALIEEAQVGNSKRDMAAKYAIALREAREANYWARLAATDPRWSEAMAPIIKETGEFVAMLTVTVRKLRSEKE
jgi:four helix bundle protein